MSHTFHFKLMLTYIYYINRYRNQNCTRIEKPTIITNNLPTINNILGKLLNVSISIISQSTGLKNNDVFAFNLRKQQTLKGQNYTAKPCQSMSDHAEFTIIPVHKTSVVTVYVLIHRATLSLSFNSSRSPRQSLCFPVYLFGSLQKVFLK